MRITLTITLYFIALFNTVTLFAQKSLLETPNIAQMNKTVDSLLSQLTLREKIAQLYIIDYSSTQSARLKQDQERFITKEKIGGVITMRDMTIPAMERLNRFNRLSKLPLLVTIDGEWGASMRYQDLPQFPRQMQMGALNNDSLIYEVGYAIGKECRELNIHVNYAPDIDINNNPHNPVINARSFGENKEKVASYGAALMNGMKAAGVAGSAKHFPGHGDTDVDSHKGLPELHFSKERLDSIELYPFKRLIAENIDMVMVGHLDIPVLDKGRPASISKKVVTDLLRNELGYNGIVITDALNMDGVAKCTGIDKKLIPLEAYKAGVDILLMPQDVENSITNIENAFKRGELREDDLDNRVRRILELKYRLGLFDKDYNPIVSLYNLPDKLITVENERLVNEVSRGSMILVKNDDDILPLSNLEDKKIGYLGIRGDVNGKEFANTLLNYTNIDTVILRSPVKMRDLEIAKNKLRDCDLIITAFHITDARPNRNFGIDDEQMDFITNWAADIPMVVAYHGSPYAIDRINNIDNFKAFLVAHFNTPANNFISAQTVFGGVPSVGVMPVSAGWLGEGESLKLENTVRLGYDILSSSKFVSNDFYVEGGVVKGDIKIGDTLVTLYESANLFTILPFIAEMVCNGKLLEAAPLSDYINVVNSNHKNIQVIDIIRQRYCNR